MPSGRSSPAARRRLVLKEPFLKLPEMPKTRIALAMLAVSFVILMFW
jgi:hypothetical protein